MRNTFISTLTELAEQDSRIVLLTGDLGFMVLETFARKLPRQFFNVGVAEQNMVGIATGMAEAGFIPFVYSIVNFATLRPYEFIRNGPILHQFPVRIVGVGGGIEYSNNGATHYGLEDVGVMRIQQGIQVIVPADSQQTRSALLDTWDSLQPVYYRLGKDDKTIVPGLQGRFHRNKVQIVREGGDILILSMGNVVMEALEASSELSQRGIECTVAIVSSFNPGPVNDIANLLAAFPLAYTLEAHFINGGLGSLVSEVIAEHLQTKTRLIRCGIRSIPDGTSGSQKFLYEKYGISSQTLINSILSEQRAM
jgi:transketolase